MKNSKKQITIVIATLNAGKTLEKTLNSIRKQQFEKHKIEILLVDGGSKDKTLEIGRKFRCRVIKNPKIVPAYAKYLGFVNSVGQYLLFIDADEVLVKNTSLKKRIEVFEKYPHVKAILSSGYVTPKGRVFVSKYINEFGDPFSKFIYNLSKDSRFFLKKMSQNYDFVSTDKDAVIFNFSERKDKPIIELVAIASMVEKNYFNKYFREKGNYFLIPHLFYLLCGDKKSIAIMKDDAVIHYSSDSLGAYVRKIRSRVISNIFAEGREGFLGRSEYMSRFSKMKKYLFIPYSISLVLPLIDSIHLAITRSDHRYLLHAPLTLLTCIMIIYYSLLKMLGVNPLIKGYGE